MDNIFDRLSELASKKNVDVADLILSGISPEEALKFLEDYQPPLKGIKGLIRGIGRGLYSGIAGIPVGLANIAGYAIPSLGEWAREQEEYLAREYGVPEGSDLLGKVGYVLGQVGSLVAPGATLKLLGGVGKLSKLPTLEKAKDLAEPVTRYGIPTFIGATTAEQAYREQPEEAKSPELALLGGTLSGLSMALPIHRYLSKWAGTTVSPEKVKAVAEGTEKLPSTLGLMAKEAGVGALTFPAVTTGMEFGHQVGRGRIDLEELARSKAEMGLPEAIVGGLLGGFTGLKVKGAYKKSVMNEMYKDMEKEAPPVDEAIKETSPEEYEAKKEEYIGNYLDKMKEFYEEGVVFSKDGKEKITFYKVIDPDGKTTFVYKEAGEPDYAHIFEGNGQEFYRFLLDKLGYIQDIEIRSPEPTVRDRVAQNLYDLYLKAQEEINRGKVSGEQLELFRRTPVDEAIPTKEPYVFTSPESKKIPYQYGLFEPTREDYLKQYYDALSKEAEKYIQSKEEVTPEQKPYFDETGQGYLFGKPEKPTIKETEEVPPETKPTVEQLPLNFEVKEDELKKGLFEKILHPSDIVKLLNSGKIKIRSVGGLSDKEIEDKLAKLMEQATTIIKEGIMNNRDGSKIDGFVIHRNGELFVSIKRHPAVREKGIPAFAEMHIPNIETLEAFIKEFTLTEEQSLSKKWVIPPFLEDMIISKTLVNDGKSIKGYSETGKNYFEIKTNKAPKWLKELANNDVKGIFRVKDNELVLLGVRYGSPTGHPDRGGTWYSVENKGIDLGSLYRDSHDISYISTGGLFENKSEIVLRKPYVVKTNHPDGVSLELHKKFENDAKYKKIFDKWVNKLEHLKGHPEGKYIVAEKALSEFLKSKGYDSILVLTKKSAMDNARIEQVFVFDGVAEVNPAEKYYSYFDKTGQGSMFGRLFPEPTKETSIEEPSKTKETAEQLSLPFGEKPSESRSDTISEIQIGWKGWNKELSEKYHPIENIPWFVSVLKGDMPFKFYTEEGKVLKISPEGLNKLVTNIFTIKNQTYDKYGNQFLGFGYSKYEGGAKPKLYLFYKTPEGKIVEKLISNDKDLAILDTFEYSSPDKIPTKSTNIPTESTDIGIKSEDVIELENQINSLPTTKLESPYTTISQKALSGVIDEGIVRRVKDFIKQKILEAIYDRFYTFKEEKIKGEGEYYEGVIEKESGSQLDKHFLENVPYGKNIYSTVRNYRRYKEGELKSPPKDVPIETLELLDKFLTIVKENPSKVKQFDLESINKLFSAFIDAKRIETETLRYIFDHFIVEKEEGISFSKNLSNLVKESAKEFESSLAEAGNTIRKDETAIRKEINKLDKDLKGINSKIDNLTAIRDTLEGLLNNTISKDTTLDIPVTILHSIDKKYEFIKTFDDLAKMINTDVMFIKDLLTNINLRTDKLKREFSLLKGKRDALLDTLKNREVALTSPLETLQSFKDLLFEYLSNPETIKELSKADAYKKIEESIENVIKILSDKETLNQFGLKPENLNDIGINIDTEIADLNLYKTQLNDLIKGIKKAEKTNNPSIFDEFMNIASKTPSGVISNLDRVMKKIDTKIGEVIQSPENNKKVIESQSQVHKVKDYITISEDNAVHLNIDAIYKDIREIENKLTSKISAIDNIDLKSIEFKFGEGANRVTKTLYDLISSDDLSYNPFASKILYSVATALKRAGISLDQGMYDYFRAWYKEVSNPAKGYLGISFIPKDFENLRKTVTSNKLVNIDGYIFISVPSINESMLLTKKYMDTQLVPSLSIVSKLPSISEQSLLVLDAKTFLKKGNIYDAMKNVSEPIPSIIKNYFRNIYGNKAGFESIAGLFYMYDSRKYDAKTLKTLMFELGVNDISELYTLKILNDFVNRETVVRELSEKGLLDKRMSELVDKAYIEKDKDAIRELYTVLERPLGINPVEDIKVIEKIVKEDKAKKGVIVIDKETDKKGKSKPLPDIDFRSISEETKINPTVLKDPINYINFMKETIARVLGEDVNILIAKDIPALTTLLNNATGNKILGFALKLKDKNILGILIDGNVPRVEDAITMGHELAHFIWDKIPSTDKNLILSKYKTVENFADAFGRYIYGKYSPPSFAKRAFDAIINLWDRLVNIFRGYGFRSAQDIFDKIEAGEYATKNPNEVPTARFIDAWELSRLINENHRESDWEIAFRTKSQESNELLDRLMTQANKAIDYAKGVTLGVEGEPNIFKYLYNRAKDVLRLPIFHEYLKGIVDRYKMAQGYVSEVIMTKYEDVFNMMKLLKDRNLLENLKRVVIASDVEGRYFVDLPERLREQNPNLTESDIKAIVKAYNTLKDFTDRIYITIHKQGFLKLASIMKGQASFEAARGNLTPEQKERIIVETDKLINNLNNDFYRFYEYEIIEGERRPIGGKRRNYEQYIKEYVNNIITILNDNQITTLYNKAIEGKETIGAYVEALNAMKEELRQLENPNNDFAILASIIASNTHRGYDLFREVLDNGFYFPRVRGEGNYEARVYFKIPVRDEKGKIIPNKYRYVEIEYLDTDRNKFDRTQQVQQQQILSRLKETYKDAPVMDTIEAYAKDISIDKALNEFVKRKYNLTDITAEAPEYVIVAGRKAPKEKPMLYRFTPSEVISFIGNLALRAGSEKLSAEIRDKLPQMIGEMYADINYAMARKLHRHWLPKDAKQKAIAGYKEDIQDVLNEYAIRMQGHLSNNIFLTDIMNLSYSPEFREFSLRNPQAKDLIDKQISLYLSPNTNIANAVYKMRAITATMYLGLRLSSALLNYMNFPMLFIPEYNDLKASGFNRYLNKIKSGIDVVLGGVGEGVGDINRIDVLKKYPEAWKDLGNAIKLVEKYASQKFTFENIFGEKVTVPILDRMSMKVNIEPIKQELSKAIERNDKAKIEQLQRDLFILEGLNKLVHEQTIESSMYHTLRMEGMHLFGKTLNKLFDGAFFPFRMTERHVRTVSAVMVLNEIYNQVSKGKTFEQIMGGLEDATRIASNIIDQTYFRYDRLNRYWWTNPSKGIGAIMSMPTTLRGFTANFLSAMFTWAERKQWNKIATSMATLFVLGGFGALPMVDDLLNQMEKITGSPIRLKTYKMLKDTFGDEDIAKVITRGLPSFLIDFSSAMKVEFPLLPKSWDFNGFAEMFFGVHKDLMERIFTKAPQAYGMGDYLGAISYLTPLGIGLPLQAYGLTTEGLKTKYGRTISDIETGQPFKLSTEEAILRGLGFRPIRLAEIQDLRYYGTKIAKKYDEWRTRIYSQLRSAKDFEDMKKVTDEIVEFNKSILEYGGAIAPITPESLRRAQRPRKDEALLISRNLLTR